MHNGVSSCRCADRALYLHLFLHARGVLSAAIRLNHIGPYAAQQLLLHSVQSIIEREMGRYRIAQNCIERSDDPVANVLASQPASTWPLGELLTVRHDLQHSRIFNS